jgi:hypothetical protein
MAPTAWMVHAPDYTSPGTFEKRMAVRAEHLVGFKQLIAAGTVGACRRVAPDLRDPECLQCWVDS